MIAETEMQTLDRARADAFAEKTVGILNGAAQALMISIGHKTDLFDVMAGLAPSTSAAIARAAGLDERYVREWLGAMTSAGIVEVDETTGTYALPQEHAEALTKASPASLASAMQWVSVLGSVEERVVDCFRKGGGVPYEAFPRFHETMAEESEKTVVTNVIDAILPLVPQSAERLRAGIDVADVGCGVGRALLRMAEAYPRSRFVGFDFSAEAIGTARCLAAERGLANVRFEVRDAARLDEPRRFDLVTAFDAIHDQVAPAQVLAQIRWALKPGGTFLMQDIRASSHVHENRGHVLGPFLYTISTMHCMTVSLANGGAGLGTCWGKQTALAMLAEAGFGEVEVHELEHDIMNDFYVARPA